MTFANLCWPSIPNRLMHHVFGNISRAFRDISNSALGSVVISTTLRASEMEHTVRQKATPRVSQIMTCQIFVATLCDCGHSYCTQEMAGS